MTAIAQLCALLLWPGPIPFHAHRCCSATGSCATWRNLSTNGTVTNTNFCTVLDQACTPAGASLLLSGAAVQQCTVGFRLVRASGAICREQCRMSPMSTDRRGLCHSILEMQAAITHRLLL